MALALVALLAACSDDADPNEPSAEEPFGLGETAEGRCLLFDEEVGAEITELPVVECSIPHSHEIFAVINYADPNGSDVYPGFDALDEFAQRRCLEAFEPYVGTNPFDSTLFHSWFVPTLDSWNDEDDDEVLCVLGAADGAPLDRSMRNANV